MGLDMANIKALEHCIGARAWTDFIMLGRWQADVLKHQVGAAGLPGECAVGRAQLNDVLS